MKFEITFDYVLGRGKVVMDFHDPEQALFHAKNHLKAEDISELDLRYRDLKIVEIKNTTGNYHGV